LTTWERGVDETHWLLEALSAFPLVDCLKKCNFARYFEIN